MSPDGHPIPRAAYNLPEYDGSTTHGVLITSDGSEISFTSGGGDPRYTNYANNGHVEQKSSLYMRDNNISSGVVYHNNTEGTCGFCNTMTSTFLPEGATLTVVPPSNAVATNSKAVDVPKTYTGNSKDPKISSRYTGN
ncbi:DddA-like double-stranded DNA deaminase toxin [Lacrimispora xylanisolvens]|uniref:DddA-like double-stranded DNA deaminase toxin n=1 Tax=Lacrimispora xylanisolvens TaxID=384636 RepID=UPI002402AF2A